MMSSFDIITNFTDAYGANTDVTAGMVISYSKHHQGKLQQANIICCGMEDIYRDKHPFQFYGNTFMLHLPRYGCNLGVELTQLGKHN